MEVLTNFFDRFKPGEAEKTQLSDRDVSWRDVSWRDVSGQDGARG
jgi:hypothetical protein